MAFAGLTSVKVIFYASMSNSAWTISYVDWQAILKLCIPLTKGVIL